MGYALIEEFIGAADVTPLAGNNAVLSAQQVTYPNLWQGISLQYTLSADGLAESIYTLAPHADPARVQVGHNAPFQIKDDGSLRFQNSTSKGWFSQTAPIAWQNIGEQRVMVKVAFTSRDGKSLGFQLGKYDPEHALIIDPVYRWHTFYGGSENDYGKAIAVDRSGNVFVTGYSLSTWLGDDNTSPLHPHSEGNKSDITVLKLDSNGRYQWHTFYGTGSKEDHGRSVVVDTSGNVLVTGDSEAQWLGDNDATDSAPANNHSVGAGYDITVLKLDSNGKYLQHTFQGGNGSDDDGKGITVNTNGDVFVTGYSEATWGTPLNDHTLLGDDLTVVKLGSNLDYTWHTFYGSGNRVYGESIIVDENGNVLVAGVSEGTWGTPLHTYSGFDDIAVLKLDTNGDLKWNTFYGSGQDDSGNAVTVDKHNNIIVTGTSYSTWNVEFTLPLHSHNGGSGFIPDDIAVLKLDSNGAYQWHTFYGSSDHDKGQSITTDSEDNIFIAGLSNASWLGDNDTAPVHAYSGGYDITMLKLNPNGRYLEHTFYGSSSSENKDFAYGIARDNNGSVFVVGESTQTWTGDDESSPLHPYTSGVDVTILKLRTSSFPWTMFLPAIIQSVH